MGLRESFAYAVAKFAGGIAPFWRFRLWSRLVGGNPYDNHSQERLEDRIVQPHGFTMTLNTADWMERYASRSGYFYQDDLVELVLQRVSAGDQFIDVGANIGFMTLLAARCVGPDGQVFSFEPNPLLVQRLNATLKKNNISNVTIFQTALGDRVGKVSLVEGQHHGTNRISVETDQNIDNDIPLAIADELLEEQLTPDRHVFVKIDVEGAELGVIKGMQRLMTRRNVTFLVEIGDEHSRIFGNSADDVFDFFAQQGYFAYSFRLSPFSRRLKVTRLSSPLNKATYDVMFSRA